ncbi:MAG TPA: hypothetical protein VK175_15655 [Leadbetterella sp.]|nr:hypothetical protein [Leadbetterella sp.]
MHYNPKEIKKDDFYQLLDRRFKKFSEVIPVRGDGGVRMHYLQMGHANVMKIKNLVEKFDLIGTGFWGYGINKVSNGKEEYSNLDLIDVEKTDGLNRHIYYDNFHFLIFTVKDEHFIVNTFAMLVGRSIIKTENLVKIHMSNFRSAGFTTDGLKMFVNFAFDGLPKSISFQVDPYIDTLNFAKYYIDTMESLAITKSVENKTEFRIENIHVSGGQANIAGEIKDIKYNKNEN